MIEVVLLTFLAAMLTALIGWLLLNEIRRAAELPSFRNGPGAAAPRPGPATGNLFQRTNVVVFRPRTAMPPAAHPVFRVQRRKEFRARTPVAGVQTQRLPVRCRRCGHYPGECRCDPYRRNNEGW